MAKQGRAPKYVSGREERLDVHLVGTSEVLAQFADVFVLATDETGMGSLYFYQRLLPDRGAMLGTTEANVIPPKAQCLTRIIMAPQGIQKLLEAMAENRGFTLTPKAK